MRKYPVVLKYALISFLFLSLISSSCKSSRKSIDSLFKKPKSITVVVDPGHGGSDAGSAGPTGLEEKDINLKVALRLKRYLQDDNVKVIMTRTNDKFLKPSERVAIANKANADIFISIHHNHYFYKYVNGSKIYIRKKPGNDDKNLAREIQKSIVKKLKFRNMGLKPYKFYVLDHTKMTSVLTEPSFISNYKNESLLKNADQQDKEAKAIYLGIKKFTSKN